MTRLTVYKQIPINKRPGAGCMKNAEPAAEHIQYVCEVYSISRDEKQRFFGASPEVLARTVSPNVKDSTIDFLSGAKYQVMGTGENQVKTEVLDSDEFTKFRESLKAIMWQNGLPGKK